MPKRSYPAGGRATKWARTGKRSAQATYSRRPNRSSAGVAGWVGHYRKAGYYGRFNQAAGTELKFRDYTTELSGFTAPRQLATLCGIPQGVGQKERIGRKCTIKSINWRFSLQLPEVTQTQSPPNSTTFRVLLYLDTQCNGEAALITDILQYNDFMSFNNLANKGRFRVLMDKFYTLNYGAMTEIQTTGYSTPRVFKNSSFFKKVNIPIEFDSSLDTGALSTIRSNNIGLWVLTRAGLDTSTMEGHFRIRYADN